MTLGQSYKVVLVICWITPTTCQLMVALTLVVLPVLLALTGCVVQVAFCEETIYNVPESMPYAIIVKFL